MKHMSKMMEGCMRVMKEHGRSDAMGEKFGGPGRMCGPMAGAAFNTDDLAKYATPELRTLFEDWLIQMEEEILDFAKSRKSVNPDEVAEAFKISRESAIFLLSKLAQKEKIDIDGITSRKEDHDGNDG